MEVLDGFGNLPLVARVAAALPGELSGALSNISSAYSVDMLLEALAGLGFSQEEAKAAIEKVTIPDDLSLEEAVRFLVKEIGRK